MINKSQYNYLSFFITRVLFIGGGFSFMFNKLGNSTIVSSLLGMLLGYFLLYIFYKKGINSIIKYFITIIILFINVLGCSVLSNDYLLTNTPTIFIILLFIFICFYGSKDIKIIGRVSFILFFITLFIIIMASVGLVNKYDYSFNIGNDNILFGIILFATLTLLPNLLIIDYSYGYRFYDISKGYIIGCLSNINIMVFIKGILGIKMAKLIRFPEYFILKHVNLFGFVKNIEGILVMEWIVTIILSGMVCINILRKKKISIYIISSIVILILIILNSNYNIIFYIKNHMSYLYMVMIGLGLVVKNKSH